MQPVEFPQQTCVFAKDQPEYLPLPAHVSAAGEVTSCWGMGWRERLRLLLTGKVYFTSLTFGGPLQPQIASVDPPPMLPHSAGFVAPDTF